MKSQYAIKTKSGRKEFGMRIGANERFFPLRSVVDGNVQYPKDDGYERLRGKRSKSGRSLIERMLRQVAPDGGQLWFTLDEGALQPWENASGAQFHPPDPAMALKPWNEDCDKRLASFKGHMEQVQTGGGNPSAPAGRAAGLQASLEAEGASFAEATASSRSTTSKSRKTVKAAEGAEA